MQGQAGRSSSDGCVHMLMCFGELKRSENELQQRMSKGGDTLSKGEAGGTAKC